MYFSALMSASEAEARVAPQAKVRPCTFHPCAEDELLQSWKNCNWSIIACFLWDLDLWYERHVGRTPAFWAWASFQPLADKVCYLDLSFRRQALDELHEDAILSSCLPLVQRVDDVDDV